MILILPITKIFDKIYACNLDYISINLTYFAENSVKIARSYDFLAENRFFAICLYFTICSKF